VIHVQVISPWMQKVVSDKRNKAFFRWLISEKPRDREGRIVVDADGIAKWEDA